MDPPTDELVRFESFIRVPEIFFAMIGVARYGEPKRTLRAYLKHLLFWSSCINTGFCLVIEHIYFVKAAGNFTNFLQLTALAPCMGFTALSFVKIMTIKLNETKLTDMLHRLDALFPSTVALQQRYGVYQYNRESQVVMKSFSILYMILIWMFNLLPLVSMVAGYVSDGTWHKQLPYFMWYWYDWHRPGYFAVTFLHQNWGGFVSAVFYLSTDLMFCAIVLLLCLQFDIVAYRLSHALPDDHQELVGCVRIHQAVIELCNELEHMFSPSLLVNFLSSSVIICLVGFQATAGITPADLFKFVLFLVSSLVQVFLLCYYGNKLIVAVRSMQQQSCEQQWLQ